MPDLNAILVHFSPELILAIGALAVLLYDMVVRGRSRAQAWFAVVTLLAAVAASIWLYAAPAPSSAPVELAAPSGGVVTACGQHAIFEVRDEISGAVVRCGSFVSDGFTLFFRLLGALTALLVVLAGMGFMRRRTAYQGEFYAILLLATLAMNLMAGANDLVLVALSIEFLSLSSYVLTGFLRGDGLSIEAGLKYFLYGSIAGAIMLFGLTMLYGVAGTTSLPAVAAAIGDPQRVLGSNLSQLVVPALLLVMVGMAFKIALVPFHQWSPDAYHGAPTPITAFLSVGPKLAGFAVLIRFLATAFGHPSFRAEWLAVLTGIAVLTMVLGNVIALSQTNIKRMMAYSSIAQAGYMLVGLVAYAGAGGAQLAVSSVLVFLVAYLFTNLGAFAVIIAVDDATGSSDIAAYTGLMRRHPLLGFAMAVFFLSLVGIPPLSGFIGKFAVFRAAISAGQPGLAVVGVVTGVISVGYYFRVLRAAFFAAVPPDAPSLRVAPLLRGVIVVALVMTFVIGLYAAPFVQWSNDTADALAPVASGFTTWTAVR